MKIKRKGLYQKKCAYGMGTFTKEFIPANTIILEEKIHNIPDAKDGEYWYKLIKHLLKTQKQKFLDLTPHTAHDFDYETLRENHAKHLPELSKDEMILYYLKIKHNIFGFGDHPGILFYGTRINHSCNPNVTYYKRKDHMVFKTTRDIPAESEIFDSYIDNTLPRNQRRSILQDRYMFFCECEKCKMR
jgi:SET domain-containing protein